MTIDLTTKSNELKDFVRQFETTKFLGDISSLMYFIKSNNPTSTLHGLSSPQRQLFYLAGLNLSTDEPDHPNLKHQYSQDDFEHIKKLLNEIETGYEQFFYPKPGDAVDDEWKQKRKIAMPTFLSYFNQGLLNYDEQIIARVEEYFTPFDKEITNHFGLSVRDFLEIYDFIDKLPNQFLMEKINKKEGQKTWEEFCNEMMEKGLTPDKWQEHLPEHYDNLFNWMYDKGSMNRFTKKQLEDKFGKQKAESFLSIFTCERKETGFLYYTEKNVIHYKPIFKISDDLYQAIEMNQIVQSIYNNLVEFCTRDAKLKEPFYKVRGEKLEDKIEEVFQKFFKGKAFVHRGYFTQDAHEQDLLFLYDGLALIVEAKASKRDEPRREPEKAYPLILSNFDETIQKGYDQAYRVKSKFIDREVLKIYKDQGLKKHVIDIRTKNYHSAFSIIVTLDRFGQIQTDLSGLLDIYDDDEYPWSICIDDLESFLLLLDKKGLKKNHLTQFLKIREKLHERLVAGDELEVCGAFVDNRLNIKQTLNKEIVFVMTPDLADVFDLVYQTQGLGFKNEKNMEMKTSGNYIPLGGY